MQEVRTRRPRPFLVAFHAIWFAVAASLYMAFLVYLGVRVASECQLPTAENGNSPLDFFRSHRAAILLGVVWLPIASWGLWRGVSWVRHLILASWVLLLAATQVPFLAAMPASVLVKNIALTGLTSGAVWWYLFRKRAVVAFFSSRVAQ